jgi:hypothetical protein
MAWARAGEPQFLAWTHKKMRKAGWRAIAVNGYDDRGPELSPGCPITRPLLQIAA